MRTRTRQVKWKRAEGVAGPSPGPVFGGNGRALVGPKGPYLMPVGRTNLKARLNRPVQSQAANWATVGLLAGPLACSRASQQPRLLGSSRRPHVCIHASGWQRPEHSSDWGASTMVLFVVQPSSSFKSRRVVVCFIGVGLITSHGANRFVTQLRLCVRRRLPSLTYLQRSCAPSA
jgi:hypothetical protein